MQCRNPYMQGMRAFGCGQCIPCRINRRRLWVHRIMMEKRMHSHSAFVTLTYATENYALTEDGRPTLDPTHLQKFLKRLRKRSASKLRYFAVGEYDDNKRPHYHLILFGLPTCEYGITRKHAAARVDGCCFACNQVRLSWPMGFSFLGTVEPHSVRYVCGYVVQKMRGLHEQLYDGLYPEFARMSLRPGLGVAALGEVLEEWNRLDLERIMVDVPTSLRNASTRDPLGRYLTHKLRTLAGRDEHAPPEVIAAQEAKLYDLRVAARSDNEDPSFKSKIKQKFGAAADATEARYRNFGKRKTL